MLAACRRAALAAAILALACVALVLDGGWRVGAEEPLPTPSGPAAPSVPADAVADSTSFHAANAADRVRWFPPRFYLAGAFCLPKVTYSDRRGLGLGGDAVYPFRWPGTSGEVPGSELALQGRVTLEGQTELDMSAELHPLRHYGLRARVAHETLVEHYYGVGPDAPASAEEVYRPGDSHVYVELFRDVRADFRLGWRFEVERVELLETEPGGSLGSGETRGSRGGEVAVGTGLVLDWDRRDSRHFPRRGFYLQSFALFFDEEFGSDFDFNNYHLDVRGYLPAGERQVLAFQAFTYAAKGQPPFWHLAELGGRPHSRGYRRGRYRDRVFVAGQVEYRTPLVWKLGLAAFVGVADLASDLERLEARYLRASFGGGPRFFVGGPGSEVTVRFDVGFGGEVPRYYFSLGEAF